MRIAIADGDPDVADVLAYAASRRGHQSVCVSSAVRLFDRLPFEPTVVVAAVPDGTPSSIDMVGKLRAHFQHAALYITVERPKEPTPTRLIEAGATDVIRVPYNPSELLVRAESWLAAKGSAAAVSDVLTLGDLEIALDRYSAKKNGRALTLTKLELRLLYCLAEHHPHVAPLERLLTFGWDTLGDPDAALIKTHISHIRMKLREAGGDEFEITSRQTIGYVLSLK